VSRHWLTRRTGLVATAPPATQLSTRSVLDTGTRPSAPEPDADVIFSRPGLATGQHLIDVHDRRRAALEQVRDLLAQGITTAGQARGELNRLTIRANDWTLGGACQAPERASRLGPGCPRGRLAVQDLVDGRDDDLGGAVDGLGYPA
jgi:hypothetical protein